MTLAPRFLVHFWFGFCMSRFRRQLKKNDRGIAAQEATFAQLIAESAKTHFGQSHGLTEKTTYNKFRSAIPPTPHEGYASLIEQMTHRQPDVLASGSCELFVETAGATTGSARLLPVPDAMLRHYHAGLRASAFLYALQQGHPGLFLGRHLHIGASTSVRASGDHYRTSLDGVLAIGHSPWIEANLRAPADSLSHLAAGPDKNTALAQAMRNEDVTLIAGTPADVLAFAEAAREQATTGKQRPTHLQAIWPNLECYFFTGAPLGLHAAPLRELLGPTIRFNEIYLTAEGIIAAQDHPKKPGLRLLTNVGIFFEFLPLTDYHPDTLAAAGEHCLPLADVQPDVDYVLLITTPAGLCRYEVGDIVRFLSIDPPRLQLVSRLDSQLNLCGEHVSERELTDTLLTVCRENGWHPVNFHVAPYVQRVAAGQTVLCHEWWLELLPRSIKTPTALVLGPGLDAGLRARNPDYAAKRTYRKLAEPCVRLVMPGVFARWAEKHRPLTSASKLPRSRADRLIADQLGALAGFHQASAPTFTPQ